MSRQVDSRLAETTRDRTAVELESSIRIFEKAYGWAKLVGGIVAALVALLIAGAAWESINLRDAVKTSETSVASTKTMAESAITQAAVNARQEITSASQQSVHDVTDAANEVTSSSKAAQSSSNAQSVAITKQVNGLREDIAKQAGTVAKDVTSARQQIQAASELQPQMSAVQLQLREAQTQIKEQQKVITSSAEFAKQIFSSHVELLYDLKTEAKWKYATVDLPPQKDVPDRFVLYLRLLNTPVPGTLQMQFNQTPSAPGSFFSFHNLLVVDIQKQAREELLGHIISVSYFPDPSDKVVINKLEVKDGRVFADGEALPKFFGPDPDFKGSKLVELVPAIPNDSPISAPSSQPAKTPAAGHPRP